jgi:heparan sulfate N-deacetylase/N-sulfotransferase NDST2
MLYPDMYPTYLRRGFTYNGIMVAPRQTFNLWTLTVFFKENHEKWIQKYEGGELFEILLYNQVSILMTHMDNYAGDRLAVFLLENVFDFLSKWTNLIFYSLPPLEIVEKYFKLNPDDQEPLWTVSSFRLKV